MDIGSIHMVVKVPEYDLKLLTQFPENFARGPVDNFVKPTRSFKMCD